MFKKLILALLIATSFTPKIQANPDGNSDPIEEARHFPPNKPTIYTPIPSLVLALAILIYFDWHSTLINYFFNKS